MTQKVKNLMSEQLVALHSNATVRDGARQMRDRNVGAVAVVDQQGNLCGLVTDRDMVIRCIADGLDPERSRLGDICTVDIATIDSDADLERATQQLDAQNLRRLVVVDEGKPRGMFSRSDLARAGH